MKIISCFKDAAENMKQLCY